ncbi:MAG: M20/M25/M40 family metallo-hydrolase [Thermodesulfobacteriota bacterium]
MHGEEDVKKVLAEIDTEALVDLAQALGNIASPRGREKEVGDFLHDWLLKAGFSAFKQEVLPDRNNVVAKLPGTGQGRSLIFNSHMDTGVWQPEDRWTIGPEEYYDNHAWVENGKIYGAGVVNDKGPLAAFVIAAKAIRDSGIRLRGDIVLSGVIGEVAWAPIDEFQDSRRLAQGNGSRHLIEHGVWGDYALVAETTNFGLTWAECSTAFFKVTVHGRRTYTPYYVYSDDPHSHCNPIFKMSKVIQAVEEFGREYEQKHRYQFEAGTIVPKIAAGAIRGGNPCSPEAGPAISSIYLSAMLPPCLEPGQLMEEIRTFFDRWGIEADIQLYMFMRGYVGQNIEPLKEAIEKAHNLMFNSKPGPVPEAVSSMWRDINIFNGAGIPAITYGPGRGVGSSESEDRIPHFTIKEFVTASKVYALTALFLCG